MKRLAIAVMLLVAAIRWLLLYAVSNSDTTAHLLFGPARLEASHARQLLPAIHSGTFRFVVGEVAWLAIGALAGLAIARAYAIALQSRNTSTRP